MFSIHNKKNHLLFGTKMIELNNIYNVDCLDGFKSLPDNFIDMVVTSPPYDDLRKYGNEKSTWNENIFRSVAKELFRVIKDGGVVVWIVNDKTEKGSKTLTSFRQALFFQSVGFLVNDVMIWEKTNAMPTIRQTRYTDVFEYMFVLSKGKPKTFNPIMIPCKCAGQNYNSTCKNMGGENGRTHKNFNINKEKIKGNIWEIAIAQNKTKHPAVYPYKIAYDHILSWSNEGDVILDPFMGSGTTALACIKTKRKYIGFEINGEYVNICKERISEINKEKTLF